MPLDFIIDPADPYAQSDDWQKQLIKSRPKHKIRQSHLILYFVEGTDGVVQHIYKEENTPNGIKYLVSWQGWPRK